MPRGKKLTKVEKAQIESLRAADKSYTFIANMYIDSKNVFKILLQRNGRMALKGKKVDLKLCRNEKKGKFLELH